jgi:predicted transcriptional regulator
MWMCGVLMASVCSVVLCVLCVPSVLWPLKTARNLIPQDNKLNDNVLQELAAALVLSTQQATTQATTQVAMQVVRVLDAATEPASRETLQLATDITNWEYFQRAYLEPLVSAGWLERTIPDKPTSPNQRYRLTKKGRAWLGKVSE